MADTYNMSDVFISYSRRDTAFARQLFDALKERDKEVWADFEDIPKAADWWAEIQAGINAADTFIFIISPDSAQSEVCRQEVEHAVANHKRLIPVLHREVVEAEHRALIHPAVNSHNWIFFRETDEFPTAFDTLITSIETDLEHNRAHTRLLVRAREWDEKGRNNAYLLQGEDLETASNWLASGVNKDPDPTDLHAEYINASRKASASRIRRLFFLVSTGMVISLILALVAAFQTNVANQALVEAETARRIAEDNANRARSLAMAASASEALANNDPDLALELGLLALEIDTSQPQVITAAANTVYTNGTQRLIPGNGEQLFAVALSPDGVWVAVGTSSGGVCLYQTQDGAELACLAGHAERATAMQASQDSRRLLTSGRDDAVRWWDTDTESDTFGQLLAEYVYEGVDINSVALDPAGQVALFATEDGRIGVWHPATAPDEVRFLDGGHERGAVALAISPSGLRALSGDVLGVIVHWDISDGRQLMTARLENNARVLSAAFSPDGRYAITGDSDTIVYRWDLLNKRLIRTYEAHDDDVIALAYAASGDTFFSASWDNTIYEWDVYSGRVIQRFNGHNGGINGLAVNETSGIMASVSYDTHIRLWALENYLVERRFLGNGEPISRARLAITDEREWLVLSHERTGAISLFDAITGERIRQIGGYGIPAVDVAMSQDGRHIAALYQDNFLQIFDTATGFRLWNAEFENLTRFTPTHVEYSPDGERVLVVMPAALHLLAAEDGAGLAVFPSPAGNLLTATYSPDGAYIAVGLNQVRENLLLIDATTGEQVRTYDGHRDGVLDMAFSPDGTLMVSGAFDNAVRVWDVATGQRLFTFTGHSDRVTAVAFSPDSRRIASASNDRSIRLWNRETGFEVLRYTEHTDRVTSIAFSPDGTNLVSSSRDGTSVIWRLPHDLDGLIAWARDHRYIPELTCIDRRLYLGEAIECD